MSNRTITSRSREALLQDLRNAQRAIDEQEFDVALRFALTARADAKGVTARDSAFACFLAAVAADMGGNFEAGFEYICEALTLDPLALPFQHSHDIIVSHLRAVVIDPARDAAEPTIERVYRALLNAGKADNDCHLRLIEHYAATDRLDDAFKLADALVELAPTCAEGWALRMTVARRLGKEDIAGESDARRRDAVALPEVRPNMAGAEA
jgi:hypothetical protein